MCTSNCILYLFICLTVSSISCIIVKFIETRQHVFRKSLRRPNWNTFIRENSLVEESFLRLEKSLVIMI